MKCPNCNSTAQVCLVDHETYIWKDNISIYLNYKCDCGCRFTSKLEVNRSEEKIYKEI